MENGDSLADYPLEFTLLGVVLPHLPGEIVKAIFSQF